MNATSLHPGPPHVSGRGVVEIVGNTIQFVVAGSVDGVAVVPGSVVGVAVVPGSVDGVAVGPGSVDDVAVGPGSVDGVAVVPGSVDGVTVVTDSVVGSIVVAVSGTWSWQRESTNCSHHCKSRIPCMLNEHIIIDRFLK